MKSSFLQRTKVIVMVRHSVIVFVILDGRFPLRRFSESVKRGGINLENKGSD